MSAKILLWDLETAPAVSYTWGRWKQNVGSNQVVREGYILCWAARFVGEKEVYYDALPYHEDAYEDDPTNDATICQTLLDVMSEADILIAHNGDKFDMRWLNAQLAKHELEPISPQKSIDTLKVAKQQFRFPSNRLDELAKYLGIDQRKNEMDFYDWIGCMEGETKSWDKMVKYNIQDLEPLEAVYLRLRPYMKRHPNLSIYEDWPGDAVNKCPKCQSSNLINFGYYYTNISKFRRKKCTDCGNTNIRLGQNLLAAQERREINRPT